MLHFKILILGVIVLIASSSCRGISVEEDVTISAKEKNALDKLRNRVLPYLTQPYMKRDIYIIRWLRARNFNIDEAEKMLLNALNWRKTNAIDSIDDEDWSLFERKFPYSVDSVNKRGQPLLIISPSTPWNIRSVLLTKDGPRLTRWMTKMLEDVTKRIREQQARGLNVTRFSMVNTLENFNLVESGCLRCLSVFTALTNTYETYYPQTMDQLVLVNTPEIFNNVLGLIRPMLAPSTRNSLKILGSNKAKWKSQLLNEIDAEELPIDLGGNKDDDF